MPMDDERDEGEDPQPGDLVIEMRDGRPVMYTQPEEGESAESWDDGKAPATEASQGNPVRRRNDRSRSGSPAVR